MNDATTLNDTMMMNDKGLDDFLSAARDDVSQEQLDAAASRFRSRLPEPREDTRSSWLGSGWRSAGAVAVLVLAVTLMPLLWPGAPGGQAFAQAQAWFERYQTLRFTMDTRQGDLALFSLTVWHEADGPVRIEMPPMTTIVNPAAGEMVTLLPGQAPMRQELARGLALGGRDDLAWLEELRDFRGAATRLDETREIDGQQAVGWHLELSGTSHTLWVAPDDFRPLLLEGRLEGGVIMTSTFAFDEPMEASLFMVPASD
ncbi:MAG: hypothetical protein AAGH19_07345 [Pseudomonadota bacterium]